ncbi:tensin 4 [Rhinolophus ferrumequinum]|uniref:Tensin 4 n=1 Tax=Rhinolophus ferrumequinum TaxID=59479 RepID=A0A671FMP1_RHIFE|nr:tensin-4 isoform X1 [Rhinolophus ferrumequinum]XP_032946280.1 tensin-4 isoform X1 [Rhinolophus ferrumequinum]KAF6300016.1 tensin 4 [Rhinolophus ferrumequinum]
MSQVMSGPLLAGGHAVGLASCEEPRRVLHPAPSPSLPPQCPYYTTEGWGAQALMAPTPPNRLQQAPQAGAKASCLLRSPGEQVSGALEALDSYIDFSLESLNQMILELDPTFQLLPTGPGGPQAEPTQSTTSQRKKEEPEALDIKYIEVTSTRSRCHDGPQRCSSPSVSPPFGSPRSGGLLLSRDVPRETRSSSESLIFSGNQGRGHQRPHPPSGAPSSRPPPSPSISIPCMGSKASSPHGLGSPLVPSPGLEKGLGGLAPQRGSRVSVQSASPASDVSYVFGSSQSLLHSSISSQQSSSRSLESPASSSSSLQSLGPMSLCTRASDIQVPSNPTPSLGQPRATYSPPLAKEHASSCPPSIANSMVDIPVVLINGCPEPASPPSQRTPAHQDFVQPGAAPVSHPCSATRSHSQTLPHASPTTSLEGPTRDMQPTMKFVMDTSKYWFKPSITREQAIELLRKEKPGAFVVRDSTSYQGSFGLALKVQEVPAPARNPSGEDSSDLIRHFLIESSAKGVHLKGADEEPYFGSLSAFVCQHSIMALALPCKLSIPKKELGGGDGTSDPSADGRTSSLKKSVGCHALYLSSVSVETLSGALAVQKAISAMLERDVLPTPTVVHFKVTEQGITLTDVQRKVFFRRHYPLTTLRFCGMDPEQRKWQKYCKPSWIFGFVAKSQTESQENVCHLFAEYDAAQPASQVISLVGALLQDTERM